MYGILANDSWLLLRFFLAKFENFIKFLVADSEEQIR